MSEEAGAVLEMTLPVPNTIAVTPVVTTVTTRHWWKQMGPINLGLVAACRIYTTRATTTRLAHLSGLSGTPWSGIKDGATGNRHACANGEAALKAGRPDNLRFGYFLEGDPRQDNHNTVGTARPAGRGHRGPPSIPGEGGRRGAPAL